MQYKVLGKTKLRVSCLGLGTMTFGGQVDVAIAQKIVDESVEAGINFFDTADAYQDGRSEEVLGQCIAKHRPNIILATKVGMGPNQKLKGLSYRQIIEGVDLSLKRLKTDYIDLYQVHRPDYSINLEETLRALDDLVIQGKVRYIGCSNYLAWYLCKALWISDRYALTQFSTTQARYNFLDRRIEDDLLKLCRQENLGVITYNPLAGGFLTGKYTRGKDPDPGTMLEKNSSYRERYWFHENFDAVETFLSLTQSLGREPVHLALRWVMNNPLVTVPIVGVSSIEQLKHALPVLDMDISLEELDQCNEVLGVAFDRYAPWLSTNPRNPVMPK